MAARPIRAILITAALAVAIQAPASAQTVAGQIVEIGSGRPVRDAIVTLLDTLGAELAMMSSDSAGSWAIDAPGPGRYRIQVQRSAYIARSAFFDLVRDQVRRFRMDVPIEPVLLAPVQAEAEPRQYVNALMAGFDERRRDYEGLFITRADLEVVPASLPVPELLREQTGVRIADNEFFGPIIELVRTGCPPKIIVNNVVWVRPPLDPAQAERLREYMSLRVDDIEAFEIYRGASSIPPRFGGTDARCGVIVTWLRTGR